MKERKDSCILKPHYRKLRVVYTYFATQMARNVRSIKDQTFFDLFRSIQWFHNKKKEKKNVNQYLKLKKMSLLLQENTYFYVFYLFHVIGRTICTYGVF